MTDLWRDHDFALPAGHPSTWEQECKQLRVKLQEAESAVNWADMTKNRAVDEAKALRARVAELEAALERIRDEAENCTDDYCSLSLCNWSVVDEARAALKGTKT